MLVGYARVSTLDQDTALQLDALNLCLLMLTRSQLSVKVAPVFILLSSGIGNPTA